MHEEDFSKIMIKSNIIQVNVESSSADEAYDVMQSFLKVFPRLSEYIIGDTRINIIYQTNKTQHQLGNDNVWNYQQST